MSLYKSGHTQTANIMVNSIPNVIGMDKVFSSNDFMSHQVTDFERVASQRVVQSISYIAPS